MSRSVHCKKLKTEQEGLAYPPFPGPLGERIFNEISKEAWAMWLNQQTILINEHRLSTQDPKARAFLQESMTSFLFEADSL